MCFVKTKIMVILFALAFLFPAVASAKVTVSPSKFSFDIVSGDIYQENITINWDGDKQCVGYITTEITPDGEGITVTYSENPIILDPGDNEVKMTVETDVALSPDNYTITTSVEVQYYVKEVTKTIVGEKDCPKVDDLKDKISDLKEHIDEINLLLDYYQNLSEEEKTNVENLSEKINNLLDEKSNLNEMIEYLDNYIDNLKKNPIKTIFVTDSEDEDEEDGNYLFEVMTLVFGILLFVTILLLLKAKEKMKNESKRKEK